MPHFVYNLHLDHELQAARENGVDLLLERIRQRAASGPIVVLGDFNAPPGPCCVVQGDASLPLKSAMVNVSEGTFYDFTGEASHDPIDYIFHSPEWHVLSAGVLRGDGLRPFPSDHFPVSAVLQL